MGLCSAPCDTTISAEAYNLAIQRAIDCLSSDGVLLLEMQKTAMKKAAGEQRYEDALACKKSMELIEQIQKKIYMQSRVRHDQDVWAFVEHESTTYAVVGHAKEGSVLEVEEFVIDDSEAQETLLRRYYAAKRPPAHIIVQNVPQEPVQKFIQHVWSRVISWESTREHAHLYEFAQLSLNRLVGRTRIGTTVQELLKTTHEVHVVDCIDISNQGDTCLVGAAVRYEDGAAIKKSWRRYRMRSVVGQNDVACMSELITRRYSKESLPDVLIVDGGIPQIRAVCEALAAIGKNTCVVGLAKKEETLMFIDGSMLRLPLKTPVGLFIQMVRDSVHNFTIQHSRACLKKRLIRSELDDISCVGNLTKSRLLRAYGSIDHIKTKSIKELALIVGKARAEQVYYFFHPQNVEKI